MTFSTITDNVVRGGNAASVGHVGRGGSGAGVPPGAKIADFTITAVDLAVGSVTTIAIGDNAVASGEIQDGSIATVDIGASQITSALVLDGTLTGADVADSSLTGADIFDNTILSADIADGTIIADDIAGGAIGTDELAFDAVTTSEILNDTIDVVDISNSATLAGNPAYAAGEVWFGNDGLIFEGATANTGETLLRADGTGTDVTVTIPATTGTLITNADVGTVNSTVIANGTIVTADIAASQITSALIADGTIATADLGAGQITHSKMAAGAIKTSDILDGTIRRGDLENAFEGTAALDFADGGTEPACTELTMTVTGAADGDVVMLGVPVGSKLPQCFYTGFVSAANTVTVQHCCVVNAVLNPASGSFTATTWRPI